MIRATSRARIYDTDDAADVLIGYPIVYRHVRDSAPARPASETASDRAQRRVRAEQVIAAAQHLGADGKTFTARQTAAVCGLSSMQVAKALLESGIAHIVDPECDVRHWQLNEYETVQ